MMDMFHHASGQRKCSTEVPPISIQTKAKFHLHASWYINPHMLLVATLSEDANKRWGVPPKLEQILFCGKGDSFISLVETLALSLQN